MTSATNGRQNAVTDQVIDVLSRGQNAMNDAAAGMAQLWGAVLPGAGEAARPGSGTPVGPAAAGEMVDRVVDTGIAVLEMQRSVAHQVLDALRLR